MISSERHLNDDLLVRRLPPLTNISLVSLAITVPLPALFLGTGVNYLVLAPAFALVVWCLSFLEPSVSRTAFRQVATVAFAWSWALFLVLIAIQRAAGVTVLGPDGVLFIRAAQSIQDAQFNLPYASFRFFGTYATGHFYVFAALLETFGPSLFNLQAFNCTIVGLLGPLTFSWTRLVFPRIAVATGLLVASFPSTSYLAGLDLWKDPLTITVTTLAIWSLAHIGRTKTFGQLTALSLIAGGSLAFIHVTRIYTLAYLEIGIGLAALVAVLRQSVRWRPATAVLVTLLFTEAVPGAFGWANTPTLFLADVVQVMDAPSLRYYTASLLDGLGTAGGEGLGHIPQSKARAVGGMGVALIDGSSVIMQTEVEGRASASSRYGPVTWILQILRRIYGPFIWILPPRLATRDWLSGMYLMYPGMIYWYVMLPMIAAGLLVAGSAVVTGRAPFIVIVVWTYSVLYSVQFLFLNLPVRQRETMFPVLAVFGLSGYHWLRGRQWARWVYILYWFGLILMATAHLIIRARFVNPSGPSV